MKTKTISYKTYSELSRIETFEDRLKYLMLNGKVSDFTFNGHRYLNQRLYQCPEWKSIRRRVIIRDDGCDLGCDGYKIFGSVLVHHINPITIDDVVERRPCVFDLENLISTSFNTHNAIHYGVEDLILKGLVIRTKNDTCLWR